MKAQEIVALLKIGKKPLVRLTDNLLDDGWGEKGMLARIISFSDALKTVEQMVKLTFDYNENKTHNLALQGHNYYLKGNDEDNGEARKLGTAFEAGLMEEDNIHETSFFMMDESNGAIVPVELVEKSPTLVKYLESGSKLSYVEWLEKENMELMDKVEALKEKLARDE